jgi:predicted nicotinamide N-methyase
MLPHHHATGLGDMMDLVYFPIFSIVVSSFARNRYPECSSVDLSISAVVSSALCADLPPPDLLTFMFRSLNRYEQSRPMYQIKFETFVVGGKSYIIRSLQDRQQFHDPEGTAEEMGISSATWSLFGTVWPSGLLLADIMSTYDVANVNILEVGCGLGLASLVTNARGARHTASDYHPLACEFIRENNRLNELPPLRFEHCDWAKPSPTMGAFDLIIGSDLLYEPDHPAMLAQFIDQHSSRSVQVIIIDPGRRQQGQFTKRMEKLGFDASFTRASKEQADNCQFSGKILSYSRNSR